MLRYSRAIRKPLRFLRSATCLMTLTACGVASDEGGATPTASATHTVEIRGVVLDGYIEGANVFLDVNGNHTLEAGEPAGSTDAQGAFALQVSGVASEQLAQALLQAEIPDSAKDADDLGATLREAGKSSFTMLAPVSASAGSDSAVISPLSTLVAGEMVATGRTVAEAKASVQARLGLEGKELLQDFVATPDAVLHNVARAAAISLGEAARAAAEAARESDATDGGLTVPRGQLVIAALESVREQLPELVESLDLRRPDAPASTADAVREQWAKQHDRKQAPAADAGSTERPSDGAEARDGGSHDAGVTERPGDATRPDVELPQRPGDSSRPDAATPDAAVQDATQPVDAGVGTPPVVTPVTSDDAGAVERPVVDADADDDSSDEPLTRPVLDAGVLAPVAELPTADAGASVDAAEERPAQRVVSSVSEDTSGTAATDSPVDTEAATLSTESASSRRYIVVFRSHVGNPNAEATSVMRGRGGQITHSFSRAVKGFAVTLPKAAASAFLEAMERNPNVDHVEVDATVSTLEPSATETASTWGLDRIDQRDLPLSSTYAPLSAGSGVTAYIVDTGILATHADFGGRVAGGYTAIDDGYGTSDCHGHGTHVAGTVGGAAWGVAKSVSLVPVRVLSCTGSGTLSGVIAGLDWVIANAKKPAVVNMSLGSGASSAIDTAVANVVASGITVVVAAGNSGADACDYSPARAPAAITVGATTSSDARASYSNYGSCLDLFAPGSSIKSSWYTSTSATATLSGTSMAAPHVAGVAAVILQAAPAASPSQIDAWISDAATRDKVASAGSGSPNRLLYAYVGDTDSQPPPPEAQETVVSLSSLTGAATTKRGPWRAIITAGVRNAEGAPVAGALVSGAFTAGGASVQCTTSSDGSCNVSSGNLSPRVVETTFSVSTLSGTNLLYDPAHNVASTVLVRKP